MATQATAQAGAGDGLIDELARDRQQVVGGQQECPAQLHDEQLLSWRQRRVHRVRTVGTVCWTCAILPFPDRLPGDIVEPGQRCLGERGVSNFLAYQVSRSGLAVQGLGHEMDSGLSLLNSVRKTCLALKSGQLRMGT